MERLNWLNSRLLEENAEYKVKLANLLEKSS
jgi:hypothetical protein